MNDAEVMLTALSKERDELHEQLMHVDRIIKKIKNGEYFGDGDIIRIEATPQATQPQRIAFPKHTDTKVIVLQVFDNLGHVASLRQVQDEYNRLASNNFNIRESVRSLHNHKLLWFMKLKHNDRGILWLKREWVENGVVLDQYKPAGFDALYKSEQIQFV